VATAYELGWSTVTNGDLIRLAEQGGYELLITTDTNLRYQQNLKDRNLAILVLTTTSWPRIRQVTDRIVATIALIETGGYEELLIP
jgi:glutamate racemase